MTRRPTTKRTRERLYASWGLKPRSEEETRAFLAMIERQGREAQARGERLLASYVEDQARLRSDGHLADFPGMHARTPDGAPLTEYVADRTEAVLAPAGPLFITRPRRSRWRKRRWWELWLPNWVRLP